MLYLGFNVCDTVSRMIGCSMVSIVVARGCGQYT